ncbi:MAG TPA: hypothetical protein VGZ22_21910 [Isosphaeraceae bacterium]|nr:hypothetical protein [Isosphaeraceae bacterium]
MKNRALLAVACLLYLVIESGQGVARAEELAPRYERRWIYASQNLLVDKNVDQLIELIQRAGKCGYNGMMLADYKFNILDRMPKRYFENVARVRKAAAAAKLEIIPAVFPIGYSAGLLAHDPNLAEGLPVIDAPFVVKEREAVPASSPPRLANADLEETKGDRFTGVSFQDDPGKATFADSKVVHHGKVSCRMQDVGKQGSSGNGRLIQNLKVRPHACYRYSCWVKTQDLSSPGSFRLLAIGAGKGARQLTFFEGGVERTQDWKQVDVVFNSLDQSEVNLYVGLWGGGTGTLWIDERALDELAFVNVLRRPGCPLTVTSADGRTTFEEGRDFEPLQDPKLGQQPYAGEFSFAHDGPRLRLTERSRIKPGSHLKVSWYHPVLTHGEQVMCCLSEPKVYELLRDQAERVQTLFQPKTVFMSHDEIRVANWCQACQARHETPGGLVADNARRCVGILKEVMPQAQVVVWSDMFDPHHNAVKSYYLVNGSLEGSWLGLEPTVIIANWNSGKAKESLNWFADRGHSQLVAGYYDDEGLENLERWNTAAKGVPRVIGFMYTTWQQKYDQMEAYGKALKAAR